MNSVPPDIRPVQQRPFFAWFMGGNIGGIDNKISAQFYLFWTRMMEEGEHMVAILRSRKLRFLVLFVILVSVFIGCSKAPPVLKQMGPTKTKAGVAFNVQSNGESAIWAITENATKTTVIVWGERQLQSTFGGSNSVTALVPKELYSKPGQFQVYLLDKKTGKKSNGLVFTVEE